MDDETGNQTHIFTSFKQSTCFVFTIKNMDTKQNIANVIKTKTELVIIKQRQVLGLCSKGL